jgi:hypothetical protein
VETKMRADATARIEVLSGSLKQLEVVVGAWCDCDCPLSQDERARIARRLGFVATTLGGATRELVELTMRVQASTTRSTSNSLIGKSL